MASPVSPIPARYRSITPYLHVHDVAQAIAFYQKAFGAQEILRVQSPDGPYFCSGEIMIGDSVIALGQTYPNWDRLGPRELGGTPVSLMLYIANVDEIYERAVAAGATVKYPLATMFWGDRYVEVTDPFGHQWQLATRLEDLSPEEMSRRADEWLVSLGPSDQPIRGSAVPAGEPASPK